MATARYDSVPQDRGTEDRDPHPSNPLLTEHESASDSDSDWEDDRSTPQRPSTILSTSPLSLHTSESSNGAQSSQTGSDEESEATPARTSLWGGLLQAISRPIKSTREAVTDGVFGNLVAKDDPPNGTDPNLEEIPLPDENDDLTPEGQPPTYEEAAADATPSYWETAIMTYSYGDEIIVDQMPVGSLIIFAWNMLMSAALSYIGFFITYIFHTTHAGKAGSLVGFGITLIQYSYDITPVESTPPGSAPPQLAPVDPNSFDPNAYDEEAQMLYSRPYMEARSSEGNSMFPPNLLFALGIIVILNALWGYFRALRTEALILRRRREQEEQAEQAQAAAEEHRAQSAEP